MGKKTDNTGAGGEDRTRLRGRTAEKRVCNTPAKTREELAEMVNDIPADVSMVPEPSAIARRRHFPSHGRTR